nr:MAG TPA: hypothetical protein [Caudoviricetes sp.]
MRSPRVFIQFLLLTRLYRKKHIKSRKSGF